MLDTSLFKEWLDLNATKAFLYRLEQMRLGRLEAIIVNPNREEACGIVKGITLVKSLIESAKEEGL